MIHAQEPIVTFAMNFLVKNMIWPDLKIDFPEFALYFTEHNLDAYLTCIDGRLCVIAGNISPIDVITHVPILCEEANIPYVYVPSKEVSVSYSLPSLSINMLEVY